MEFMIYDLILLRPIQMVAWHFPPESSNMLVVHSTPPKIKSDSRYDRNVGDDANVNIQPMMSLGCSSNTSK